MKYFILSLSAVILFALSCTKITSPVTQQQMLRNGKWKVSSGTTSNRNIGPKTVYNDTLLTTGCAADNYLVFGAGNAGTVNTGNNKCSATEPNTQNFYWDLLNNGNTLVVNNGDLFFGSPNVNATVSNFSQSGFTMKYYVYYTYPNPADTFRTLNDTIDVTLNLSNY